MATSANGWSVVARGHIRSYLVPGTQVRLPLRSGDVATVLLYVAQRFHEEVEPLRKGWCWGYAVRPIRGQSTGYSNHASGTAADFNAPKHPRGTRIHRNFTTKQIATIRKIVRDCDGVIRWGGAYADVPDGMHFEIVDGPAAVAKLARNIRREREKATPTTSISNVLDVDTPYHRQTMLLQKKLGFTGDDVDGIFRDKTAAKVKKFKAASKIPGLRRDRGNPAVGPVTTKALGLKWTGK